MPLYLQVAQLMRKKVETGEWAYGAQIPTLDALEQEYQVSRITLRNALNELENEGIVSRTRGRGTFVARDLSGQRWFRLPTSLEQLVDSVAELEVQLLSIENAPCPRIPELPEGHVAAIYRRLRRIHSLRGQRYCLIDIYLDQAIFDADPQAFASRPVVPRLAALPGVSIVQARQILRITVADELVAAHLDIGVGAPVADVHRAFLDQGQRLLYYAHVRYPAQMIQIETDLLQSGGKPPLP